MYYLGIRTDQQSWNNELRSHTQNQHGGTHLGPIVRGVIGSPPVCELQVIATFRVMESPSWSPAPDVVFVTLSCLISYRHRPFSTQTAQIYWLLAQASPRILLGVWLHLQKGLIQMLALDLFAPGCTCITRGILEKYVGTIGYQSF